MTRTGRGNYPDTDGSFDNAPYFNFNDGRVRFDTNWVSNANENYGSVSLFLPKSFLNEARMPATMAGILLTSLSSI